MDPLKSMPVHPRDTLGSADFYAEKLSDIKQMIALSEVRMREANSAEKAAIGWKMISDEAERGIAYWYAAGCEPRQILAHIEQMLLAIENAMTTRPACERLRPYRSPLTLDSFGTAMRSYAILTFSACRAPSPVLTKRFLDLLEITFGSDHLFEVLAHAFDPSRPMSGKYLQTPAVQEWTQPVLVALSQPADKRAAALAVHMKNWPALMRPFGLKNKPREYHDLFPYFAFDVALAVCAFDIDDSSFRDNPHYPRDLVEYYRANIRHTRDADRPIGIDPGLPPMEINKPPKADLAKSKRKGIARWIELATDGDSAAVETVIEKIGKPRKVADAWDLMCALSEDVNHAVHADIKDDATAAAQAEMLAREREIGEFVPPEEPPEGPARITKTLLAFDAWLAERGHRLVGIDNGDDAFHAVVVRTTYLDELMALSKALGLNTKTAQAAYEES